MEISLSFGPSRQTKRARPTQAFWPAAASALALSVIALAVMLGGGQSWAGRDQARAAPACAQAVQDLSQMSIIATLTQAPDQAGPVCSFLGVSR